MKFFRTFRWFSRFLWALALAAGTAALALPARAAGQRQFASPEDAVAGLTVAARAKDTNALQAILGPERSSLISVDVVQAAEEFDHFVLLLSQKTALVRISDVKATLQLGEDGWPFPIPLVKQQGQWLFDTVAGKDEILNRRVGRDELGAISVCRAYVEAQREYASEDRDGDEVLEYAQHLRSSPGNHDGLYWPPQPGEDFSPLGPLVAAAHSEGYRKEHRILTDVQNPYHGYYFRILTKQGSHAPGGKYSYIINHHMIAGFALVAWPAEWGNTGVMTFIVNQQGKVYQRNLGPKTAASVAALSAYDPDADWTLVTN